MELAPPTHAGPLALLEQELAKVQEDLEASKASHGLASKAKRTIDVRNLKYLKAGLEKAKESFETDLGKFA
jgi:hypothetical protein